MQVKKEESCFIDSLLLHLLCACGYGALLALGFFAPNQTGPQTSLRAALVAAHCVCSAVLFLAMRRRASAQKWVLLDGLLWLFLLIAGSWQGDVVHEAGFMQRSDGQTFEATWVADFGMSIFQSTTVLVLQQGGRLFSLAIFVSFAISEAVLLALMMPEAPISAGSRAIVVLAQLLLAAFVFYRGQRVKRVALAGEDSSDLTPTPGYCKRGLEVVMMESCRQVFQMNSDLALLALSGRPGPFAATDSTSSVLDIIDSQDHLNLQAAMSQAGTTESVAVATVSLKPTRHNAERAQVKLLIARTACSEPMFLVGVCADLDSPVTTKLTSREHSGSDSNMDVSPRSVYPASVEDLGLQANGEGVQDAPLAPANSLLLRLREEGQEQVVPVQPPPQQSLAVSRSPSEESVQAVLSGPETARDEEKTPPQALAARRLGPPREQPRQASQGSSLSWNVSSSSEESPSLPTSPIPSPSPSLSRDPQTPVRSAMQQPKPREFRDADVITDIVAGDLGHFRCRCCAKPPLPPGTLAGIASPPHRGSRDGSRSKKKRPSYVGRGTPVMDALSEEESRRSIQSQKAAPPPQPAVPSAATNSLKSSSSRRDRTPSPSASVFEDEASVSEADGIVATCKEFNGEWILAAGQDSNVMSWLQSLQIWNGAVIDGDGEQGLLEYSDDGSFSFQGGVLYRVQGTSLMTRVGRSGRPLIFVRAEPEQDSSFAQRSNSSLRSSSKELERQRRVCFSPVVP